MLPPLSPTVPSSNPKFGALYQDLCNNKLNSDGSTKLDAKAQRERDTLSEVRVWFSSRQDVRYRITALLVDKCARRKEREILRLATATG